MEYSYFHIKAQTIKKLGWSDEDLFLLFKEILKFYKNIFITRDIEDLIIKKNYALDYNKVNLNNLNLNTSNNNIYLFDNIEGKDLFNLINNSKKL